MILACGYDFLEGHSKLETWINMKNAKVYFNANHSNCLV